MKTKDGSIDYGALDPHTKEVPIFIGSDESLKGDSFGGLTIAGVLVDEKERSQLEAIGVRDSKQLKEPAIRIYAQRIRETIRYWSVRSILPEKYNQFSQTGLMNRYHHEVADELITRLQNDTKAGIRFHVRHVVDKFPGCAVGDVIETKAESAYPEVAAASILAREAALDQMRDLSQEAGFTLPLGSTHVSEAIIKLKTLGLPPNKFLKLHFKNVQKILQDD